MKTTLGLTIFTLAIGVALGVILTPGSDSTSPDPATYAAKPETLAALRNATKVGGQSSTADLIELEQRLEHEIGMRRALEKRIEALSRQLGELRDARAESPIPASADSDAEATVAIAEPAQDWFNEQALIASGIDRIQAGQLRAFFEQLELERLTLRNQSLREGWSRENLREAMRTVSSREKELLAQLGEEVYDAYLYASGQPNRVAVTSVLSSAQAGEAGIQPGDYIMRYDNERIYDWFDLREATASGSLEDMVALEVERDGETLQFYLARGPLGIRMDSVSIAP